MLCIWRGAPDWPEGPPSSGDLSSIQPTRGRHYCFQPDAPARGRTGLTQVCGGNQPGHVGGPGLAPSVSSVPFPGAANH
uniref:Uncharacterized protein n=1 Tax=Molossus molossus TaxID=27622 RepID=A0A7J8JTA8_MOLMO|nr:hypothetical protein HJG59_004850 [Molossus molossus]